MEKNSSKVISGSAKEKIRQWRPPSVGHGDGRSGVDRSGALLTAEKLEELQKQAYDEGFEEGRKAGFEFGHKEALEGGRVQIKEWAERIDALFVTMDTPLKKLDDQVIHELMNLTIAMVKQLVRREVKTDSGQIVGVVREALSILPVSSRQIRVVLHPDDARLIREVYDVSDKELGWKIVEDPVLDRGGCRVLTETSQVDATLESRLAALIAPLLVGERDEDATQEEESG